MKTRPSTPHSPRPRGFTLIELLTVIAIIGILAAILIPVASRVRSTAKSAQCVSNLRQAGIAIQSYAAEHKNSLPPTGFLGLSPYYNKDPRNFVNSLLPYVGLKPSNTWSNTLADKSYAAFLVCPAFEFVPANDKSYLLRQTITLPSGSTVNPWGAISVGGTITTPPLTLATIPDRTWAIRDDFGTYGPNHQTYRNAVFFDAHVAKLDLGNKPL